ncbi:MAG: ABC transporter ATP-binding protein [Gemmatimonadaceae bacterium]
MMRFEGVSVRYPRSLLQAVSGASFAAPRGRITALVGPNGSGKSTLVRALIGRCALAAGRITVDDRELASLGRRELARRVSVVTQREEPAFAIPVAHYVALGRYPHAGRWGSDTDGGGRSDTLAVRTAMEITSVVDLAERTTAELSGGEWQRVRIARALAQGGEGLVLDEPTVFLDIAHEMAVFELLASMAGRGMAVLLVTHQLNLVARFAASIVLLQAGRVAASGTPAEVMRGDILERVYDWPVVVTRDPAVGAPALVALRGGARP